MHIPPHAKKVFSGIIFDIYQWEQELFDGTTATFEAAKRMNTVEVIPVRNGKILIAQQEQPMQAPCYTLFGGRQEIGETDLQTGQRELAEEAGITAQQWDLWKVFEPNDKIDWKISIYIASGCQQTGEPQLDPGEKISTRAVSFDEFIDIATSAQFAGRSLALEIFRMKQANTLEQFKRLLRY
ncbi:MAG: NUDIX domain-containing protein [Candidatus Kerfeldbacteria bacterium]|nr:NUDIX domain-containing protein [Candidatus Kerfeldbacteria bacterium]